MVGVLFNATDFHPVVLSANQTISGGLYNLHILHVDRFVKDVRVSSPTIAVPLVIASRFLSPFRFLSQIYPYRLPSLLLEYCSTISRGMNAERLQLTTHW